MRISKTLLWIYSGITLIILLLISLYYKNIFNFMLERSTTLDLWSGIGLGMALGIGISVITINILRYDLWQKNEYWIMHVTLLMWEGLVLGYTLFYMFPHIKDNVINNHDHFQPDKMWPAFCTDFYNNWHVYAFFIFVICVWILLLVKHERKENKQNHDTDPIEAIKEESKRIPILMIFFSGLCLIFIMLLSLLKIIVKQDDNAYYFFNFGSIEKYEPFSNNPFFKNPFTPSLIIAAFGTIFVILIIYWIVNHKKRILVKQPHK